MTFRAGSPEPPPEALLYLHGFRSSPGSFKARRLQAWLAEHRPALRWHCPQLPPSPREAVALMETIVQTDGATRWAVVGSSLGGFYATVISERLAAQGRSVRTVVINPAVHPARDLARHIGEQTTWHDPAERFFFRPEFIDELRALEPGAPRAPDHTLALIATGDEVLDWREMRDRHAGSVVHLIEGSDHALSDFDLHRPVLLDFLGLGDD